MPDAPNRLPPRECLWCAVPCDTFTTKGRATRVEQLDRLPGGALGVEGSILPEASF
jgi:hypothetical protein